MIVRVPADLRKRVKRHATQRQMTESEVVREALERHVGNGKNESPWQIMQRLGVVGRAKGLPTDLATNPVHMEGFGR